MRFVQNYFVGSLEFVVIVNAIMCSFPDMLVGDNPLGCDPIGVVIEHLSGLGFVLVMNDTVENGFDGKAGCLLISHCALRLSDFNFQSNI